MQQILPICTILNSFTYERAVSQRTVMYLCIYVHIYETLSACGTLLTFPTLLYETYEKTKT